MPQTLYDKIWNQHVVHKQDDGTTLLYVDRHLIHEVTSPQAFEGLRLSKRNVRNITVIAGGIIPDRDRIILEDMGVELILGPGSNIDQIIGFIKKFKR